jgi:putative addiction module component (TIGR02574 family)
MSSLIDSLGIDRLSHAERLQLLEELLDSIDADREAPPLTEAQRQELDHRLAILESDPTAVSSWEQVQSRILARLRR